MQIVIDISEKRFQDIQRIASVQLEKNFATAEQIIANGTPLPADGRQSVKTWIPVSERLPEDYIHVLCQFTLGGMAECYLAHGVFHVVGGLVMTCNEVIAWMPLPEPYGGEEEWTITKERR